jgi:hypothetical protein
MIGIFLSWSYIYLYIFPGLFIYGNFIFLLGKYLEYFVMSRSIRICASIFGKLDNINTELFSRRDERVKKAAAKASRNCAFVDIVAQSASELNAHPMRLGRGTRTRREGRVIEVAANEFRQSPWCESAGDLERREAVRNVDKRGETVRRLA